MREFEQPFKTDGALALSTEPFPSPNLRIIPDNVVSLSNYRKQREDETKRNSEIARALKLKDLFHQALNISPGDQSKTPLSFEPWTERAKFERDVLFSDSPEAQRQALLHGFKHETTIQMETNLKERYQSEISIMLYSFEGNKLRSAYFPTEDFEMILKRGQEWRKQNGSNDLEREQSEIDGFLKIEKLMASPDTKIGTKVISLSPPSLAKGTPYEKKFVDIFELKENPDGTRFVQNNRFAVELDQDGYKEKALALDPDYFKDHSPESIEPLDSYILARPINLPAESNNLTPKEIFDTLFKSDRTGREEELVLKALEAGAPFIRQFVEEICKPSVDWKQVALTFNATLNFVDKYLEDLETPQNARDSAIWFNKSESYANISFTNISAQIDHWGRKEVRQIAAGCGSSGGFSFGLESSLEGSISLENSVAVFSNSRIKSIESDQYGSLEFDCPKCNRTNKRPKGKLVSSCQHCSSSVNC